MSRIDVGYNKIFRSVDLYELSFLFFPQKSAKMLRASFIAIFIELKGSNPQAITDTGFLAHKYQIPLSSLCKARTKLRKLGLIETRNGLWRFSSRFSKSLMLLSEKIDHQKKQSPHPKGLQKDLFLLDLAKA